MRALRAIGAVAFLVVAGSVLTGCGTTAHPLASLPTRAPTAAATTPDPLAQCTHQLEYWAGEMLADFDDPGWDYQHMGLTSEKYDELRAIVAAARTAGAYGPLQASWVHDEVAAGCTRILAAAPPTTSAVGWP